MGVYFLDQYSLLHFATGILAYFWGLRLAFYILLHILFELIENTPQGIAIINKYMFFWPGGKNYPDTVVNSLGDILSGAAGWLIACYLDKYGSKWG